VHVEYRLRGGDARPVAAGTARLQVKAGLSLRVTPRVVPAGGVMRMRGRLAVPSRGHVGKLIGLQAFERGHWRMFEFTRAGRKGRYAARWRFSSGGRRTYRIRAVAVADPAYPFATGHSRPVRVIVGS
jgi:hypothetical protein